MILEGIVTTVGITGDVNVAPMGPVVDPELTSIRLRPFKTSTTYRNLKQTGQGVLHVVDDVLLLAKAAIGQLSETPPTFPASRISGRVLCDACRYFEFVVDQCDDTRDRAEFLVQIVNAGRIRDFWGFNRAKHAVLEAAILATRVHLIPRSELLAEFARLQIPVQKTAGPREAEAFDLVRQYVDRASGEAPTTVPVGTRDEPTDPLGSNH